MTNLSAQTASGIARAVVTHAAELCNAVGGREANGAAARLFPPRGDDAMTTAATSRASSTRRTRTALRPCIIIDTREQEPWTFANLPSEPGTLDSGDYSIRGLEHVVALERKSLPDLLTCCGSERERFVRELIRLRAYPYRAVVCECTLADLEEGDWRSRLLPTQVLGSVASWQARYVPFVFAGNHDAAGRWAERYLFQVARLVTEMYISARALIDVTDHGQPADVTA